MSVAGREANPFRRAVRAGAEGSRRLHLLAALGFLALVVAFSGGLFRFVMAIPAESAPPPSSDGIVALTGGAERIADAVDLLAAGKARRMLISGVHQSTSRAEIAKLTPNLSETFACCVDIDHAALNTAGNAVETARWARSHGLRSVIVVTSDYHMPRALAEMRRAMPEARLNPHVVPTRRLQSGGLLTDPEMMRIVVWEYLKYIRTIAVGAVSPADPEPVKRFAGTD